MTRTHVRYQCEACGAEQAKWLGRCPDCNEWGAVVEQPNAAEASIAARRARSGSSGTAVALADVDPLGAPLRSTGVSELDRVLGGGLIAGSVTLLAGEPGIGKSTLLLQALTTMAARGSRCLLVCAEESVEQVRLRADRLGSPPPGLLIIAETSLPAVLAIAESVGPDLIAVDSIQTVSDPDLGGAPGSVTQVRDCAHAFVRYAKDRGIATMLVGHVTKDGAIAGPRVLEHVVDTVLSFEGDRDHGVRTLRALKHRFGPTDELGVFEMTGEGLVGVPDASSLLLTERRGDTPGSVVAAAIEGARPLLVEVQALVTKSYAPLPRRSAQALDGGRLALLIAVLQERAGVGLGGFDVYANVAGGVRVAEPGIDLAVAMAVASARTECAVPKDTVLIGEVGLGGELRQVPQVARRLAEAARLGFSRAIVPASTPDVAGITLLRATDLAAALGVLTAPVPRSASEGPARQRPERDRPARPASGGSSRLLETVFGPE
jgi:DNA repair protein RadA/Sms